MELIQRFFPEPEQSYFLFGPRGTGKSTLMQLNYSQALWVDLLRPDVLRSYLARPERLYDLLSGNPQHKTIVIDEVQKAPLLLSVVHDLIEQKAGIKFILTGSSARKLSRESADLLAGRALKRVLHPFMAAELGALFNLEQALHYGLLPLIITQAQPLDTLHTYINLYLQEEVQAEGLVRNLDSFIRFLEAISFSHASVFNLTNIARECAVKRKTVENYVAILEELLLAFRLPVFGKRAQRDLSTHPKLYLFDTGVFTALRPQGPLDRPEEITGLALEGLIAQHLHAWVDYTQVKHSLSFWRTRTGLEVDFIIYGAENFYALEVKNSRRIQPQDLRGLQAFLQDYPIATAILLYRGTEILKQGAIWCIPCEVFLQQLQPNHKIWEIA